jgi:hypothetical protein
VQITGGTKLDRMVMRQVIRGFEPKTITSVGIYRTGSGPAFDLAMAHGPAVHVRPQWEDWMVSAAFARRLVGRGLHPTVVLTEADSGDQIYPRHEHNPDPTLASAAQTRSLVSAFRRAAIRAGAQVVDVTADRPYGLAPSVTLRVSDPARFLKHRLWHLLKVFNRKRNRYEGSYIGIVDAQGRDVLDAGNSTRVQAGTFWVRPDLESCSPIMSLGSIGLPGTQPPPCPA